MKKLFFSMVAVMATVMSFAQNTLVATLSHGETVTMYYGTYALRNAMSAATSGDVINLSGGAFQAVNITKGISLRGTGIDDASPTYISGDFIINVPSDDTNRFCMEGIRSTGTITMTGTFSNPYFVKSQLGSLYLESNSSIKNAVFANCRIVNTSLSGNHTAQFVNSYVGAFQCVANSASSLINCIIMPGINGSYPNNIENSQLQNCIIYGIFSNSSSARLPTTTIATNCVAVGYSALFGAQIANTNNKVLGSGAFTKIFKTFTGKYSESEQFELADEAKTTYLGVDGTEVGIHGGLLPYDSTPTYPQITKMNVANKTTADGKLSVEIEVNAAQ